MATPARATELSSRAAPIEVSSIVLEQLQTLRDQGKTLEAWQLTQTVGPLRLWAGTRARLLASWLANALGAPKLSDVLGALAWRADRTDAEACALRAYELLYGRGPLAAWEFLRNLREPIAHSPAAEVFLLTVRAITASWFRDFETAGKWLARAEAVAAEPEWMTVARAYVLEREDRYEEALAAAQAGFVRRPGYRPAFHAVAHCLRLLNRDEEAENILIEGCNTVVHGSLICELARLQIDLGKTDRAAATLDRLVAASPLMEKKLTEWINCHRVIIACRQRDFDSARRLVCTLK